MWSDLEVLESPVAPQNGCALFPGRVESPSLVKLSLHRVGAGAGVGMRVGVGGWVGAGIEYELGVCSEWSYFWD